jgi:hypothetical protein
MPKSVLLAAGLVVVGDEAGDSNDDSESWSKKLRADADWPRAALAEGGDGDDVEEVEAKPAAIADLIAPLMLTRDEDIETSVEAADSGNDCPTRGGASKDSPNERSTCFTG